MKLFWFVSLVAYSALWGGTVEIAIREERLLFTPFIGLFMIPWLVVAAWTARPSGHGAGADEGGER